MKYKLHKVGIFDYNFIEGVDGRDKYVQTKHQILENMKHSRIREVGAYGILLGMRYHLNNILNTISLNDEDHILFFEDDAVFHKNFKQLLEKYENTIKDNDFVFLGANISKWNNKMIECLKSEKPIKFEDTIRNSVMGAYGISMKIKFMKILRDELSKPFTKNYDNLIDELLRRTKSKAIILIPNLVIPNVEESEIRFSRNQKDFCTIRKLNIEEYEYLSLTSNMKSIYNSCMKNGILDTNNKKYCEVSNDILEEILNDKFDNGNQIISCDI